MATAEGVTAGEHPTPTGLLEVEVAWSPVPREVRTVSLRLDAGATIADALLATGWVEVDAARHGEDAFGQAGLSAAVWGRSRPLAHALRGGDRVEVLRALPIDPMDARRVRYRAAGGVKALRERAVKAQKT
jgi:putative ubiquitin-RnfH superfamily antitoxin RatB of RatAB toxin-antitoxin module